MVVHVQNNLHLIRLEAKRYRQLIGHLYKGGMRHDRNR